MIGHRLVVFVLLSSALGCSKLREKAGLGAADGAAAAEEVNLLTGFEGDLGIKVSSPKENVEVVLQIKGDRTRVNLQGKLSEATGAIGMADGYGLLQMKEKRAYFVSDSAKKAIVLDLEKAKDQVPGMTPRGGLPRGQGGGGDTPPTSTMKLQKTSKTDRVAGYACDEWEVTDSSNPRSKLQVCVANQGASWLALPLRALPAQAAAMGELLDGKHFPLRAIAFKNDKEDGRIEVTKVEKKALADSLFLVPAGYQETDLMSAIMGGIGAGMGGMPGQLPPGIKLPPSMQGRSPKTK